MDREEIDRLKGILHFYASEFNWQRSIEVRDGDSTNHYESAAERDRGKTARQALGREEPKVYKGYDPLYDDHAAYWRRRYSS